MTKSARSNNIATFYRHPNGVTKSLRTTLQWWIILNKELGCNKCTLVEKTSNNMEIK